MVQLEFVGCECYQGWHRRISERPHPNPNHANAWLARSIDNSIDCCAGGDRGQLPRVPLLAYVQSPPLRNHRLCMRAKTSSRGPQGGLRG